MDTLSHALWGRGLFGYRGQPWWATFWGAFPDLISFGLYLPFRLLKGPLEFGPPPLDTLPIWLFWIYDVTHSLVVVLLVLAIVGQWRKPLVIPLLAWPFHILLDIPFHSQDFFPTKFLWPLSSFTFSGVPWAHPVVWFPNLAGLVMLFYWRYYQNKAEGTN